MGQKENFGGQSITTYQTIRFYYSNFIIHFITFTIVSFPKCKDQSDLMICTPSKKAIIIA